MNIKSYSIGFAHKQGGIIGGINIDAQNKKDAEAVGKEIAEAMLPILDIHYQSLGLGNVKNIKVIVSDYKSI